MTARSTLQTAREISTFSCYISKTPLTFKFIMHN